MECSHAMIVRLHECRLSIVLEAALWQYHCMGTINPPCLRAMNVEIVIKQVKDESIH